LVEITKLPPKLVEMTKLPAE
jgi:hypothetical protein